MSARAQLPPRAPPGTFWIESGRLLAGSYPAPPVVGGGRERIDELLELGVTSFIDLTWPGELPAYENWLPGPYETRGGRPVIYTRRPIRDHGVPRDAAQMVEILDEIEAALAGGHCVYVHCRAGIGRTGTVVGCHLARRLGGTAALEELERLWHSSGRVLEWPHVPETDTQARYVRAWREASRAAPSVSAPVTQPTAEPPAGPEAADQLSDRYRGLLLGLAVGDGLAAAVQHRRPGTFTAVGDLTGGGPYDLPRGAWSDDTAVALLLADSLNAAGALDARDFSARLHRWQREGVGSSTGQCVGISAATAKAIAQAQWSGNPFAGSHDPARIDKEPMVRAGVAAAFSLSDPAAAIQLAAEVARPTHQSPVVLDACRYFAALVVGALQGASRAELLVPHFAPAPGIWSKRPLRREVAAVIEGRWREPGFEPVAGGNALDALALVLWALHGSTGYRDAVLLAVNRGLDADVNAALVGQLAGAIHGASAIPPRWIAALVAGARVTQTADALLVGALRRIAAE